jgi:hypothetical protein
MINGFDSLINNIITPNSISAGVGTVFLSFFTGKIAPKMPQRFYDLLDNNLVRIVIVSFLINQQIHQPSLAAMIATTMVLGFELLVKMFAPDTPSLAELVKSTTAEEEGGTGTKGKSDSSQGCNCYCGSTVYTGHAPPRDENRTSGLSSPGHINSLGQQHPLRNNIVYTPGVSQRR